MGFTFFFVISSKSMKSNLPTSSAGKGRRLTTPRFIASITKKYQSEDALVFAASANAYVTPTGPESSFIPYFPLIRS